MRTHPGDLYWLDGDGNPWIAEVKSLTVTNEERQLQYGLGQLMRYRHRLSKLGVDCSAVLAAEYEPGDAEWQELCEAVGVLLVWPQVVTQRL